MGLYTSIQVNRLLNPLVYVLVYVNGTTKSQKGGLLGQRGSQLTKDPNFLSESRSLTLTYP